MTIEVALGAIVSFYRVVALCAGVVWRGVRWDRVSAAKG
jgi:hypothetical protein